MADYNFIDKQGLTKFWQKSKEYIDSKDLELSNDISDLSGSLNDLSSQVSNIESSYIKDVKVDGTSVVENQEAKISWGPIVEHLKSEFISSDKLGQVNGVASLDADGKVPSSQLPDIGSSYIKDVKVDGDSVVENQEANISLEPIIRAVESSLDPVIKDKVDEAVAEEVEHLQDRFVLSSDKGAANGVATLDADSLIPANQIPDLNNLYVSTSLIGEDGGVASLDSEGKVPSEQIPDLSENYLSANLLGQPEGVASLDEDGKVPSSQLPEIESSSIIKVDTFDDLPLPGEEGKIYVTLDVNDFYKWDVESSTYKEIGSGSGDISELEERVTTIEGAVNTFSTDIGNIEISVSELEASDSQHGEDISDIKGDLETITSSIGTVSTDLGDLSSRVDDLSSDFESELANKVSYEDIVDSLISSEVDKPLSANQGSVLKSNITSLSNRVDSLQMTFKFKGTVPSYDELPASGNLEGDVYQIVSEGEDNGETYAWNGLSWIQISAAALDISSMLSTVEDVNEIINKYK